MTVKYKTVITKAGAIKLAAATLPNGKKVNFTAMAVGDGGGVLPEPNSNQTKLVNERWRHTLNKISQDKKNKNYVVAELVIPPETGGFWMRETGLYDDTGTLIAVGNMAESYKPALAEGSGRAQTVRMVIMVSDIASVELAIDTTLVMATQDYVDDRLAEHEQSRQHPDASLKEKGFVQLSSATDSASESLAATPKAVKAAYDLASGKYTAQDASTRQKGLTQLSSATDSASESLAATPKAVKAANDNANGRVPSGRKVNGRALTEDINITSQDIFNGQAVPLGDGVDLNTIQTPGIYYQSANAQAESGSNYPEPRAGSLEVYKHAGVTQVYRIYDGSRSYVRACYNKTWFQWRKQYDEDNKPNAADVDAVSAAKGGTFAQSVTFAQGLTSKGRVTWGDYSNAVGDNLFNGMVNVRDKTDKVRWAYGPYQNSWSIYSYDANGAMLRNNLKIDYASGAATFADVVAASYTGSYRWNTQYGVAAPFFNNYATTGKSEYHPVIKQFAAITGYTSRAFSMGSLVADGALSWHLHMIDSVGNEINHRWDTYGNYTAPGQIFPGNYSNFDTRFDAKYQPKGSYTPAGQAYTRGESDARYQLKNTASLGANGWHKDASTGLITQWGYIAPNWSGYASVTFPIAFPSACINVQVSITGDGGESTVNFSSVKKGSVSRTGAQIGYDKGGAYWEAKGY
ncbi:phage tail protein [Enterobacteriaceae bacterium RIT814]|nr:phage tail protein [Enterobacteriaceae bacterium RIT 814]